LDIQVDLYEPRLFTHEGPAGCNHCGGIVSESLVQILATEGINLPTTVVQRGIDSYMMHLDIGSLRIDPPGHEKRIAGLHRGNGPRQSVTTDFIGFDAFLQQRAEDMGTRVVRKLVSDLTIRGKKARVQCPDGTAKDYDLAVVATGINSHFLEVIEGLDFGFSGPKATRAFICEFKLDRSTIEQYLGDSMHVFLLNIPRLKFAALIPKGDLVTLCLLGDSVDEKMIDAFIQAPEVKQCFPALQVPQHVCHCFPRLNKRAAKRPFADRIVVVGDAATTRLNKDGIGGAYQTAKAAARTVIFHGIAEQDFREYYWPTCRRLESDNDIGRIVFGVTNIIQKSRFLRRAVMQMAVAEQRGVRAPRMSGVLWDMFTGSSSYTDLFLRTCHPIFVVRLFLNLIAGLSPLSRSPTLHGSSFGR
jgi:flavin-dependent dehydrogenase